MAKDYFQDIMPPNSSEAPRQAPPAPAAPSYSAPTPSEASPSPSPSPAFSADLPEKTIRNIQVSPSARTKSRIGLDLREPMPTGTGGKFGRIWLWGGVALALLTLGAMALVALRPTSVTVVPRSQNVLFDETAMFTAYPAATAATGTLSYALETVTLEDSEIVPAKGVEQVEERASGTITVYNEYSTQPVKLLKDTRFQTPEGLIYKVPAEILVPGKKGTTPGAIDVTVFAEKGGDKYNVGPVSRFTLPGLKSSPKMYSSVYARSTAAFSGGFIGERPAASKVDVDAARAKIRDRLQAQILETVRAKNSETTLAFVDLAYIAFETLPQTAEAGGGARVHERARVELPVFSADSFARTVAESVSADVENSSVMLKGADALTAQLRSSAAASALAPIQFALNGSVLLVWRVDASELTQALAGRDEAAFQAIIEGFPGIEEAHARIEPFWKNSFPADPAAIKVKISDPKPSA